MTWLSPSFAVHFYRPLKPWELPKCGILLSSDLHKLLVCMHHSESFCILANAAMCPENIGKKWEKKRSKEEKNVGPGYLSVMLCMVFQHQRPICWHQSLQDFSVSPHAYQYEFLTIYKVFFMSLSLSLSLFRTKTLSVCSGSFRLFITYTSLFLFNFVMDLKKNGNLGFLWLIMLHVVFLISSLWYVLVNLILATKLQIQWVSTKEMSIQESQTENYLVLHRCAYMQDCCE